MLEKAIFTFSETASQPITTTVLLYKYTYINFQINAPSKTATALTWA